MGLLEMLNPGIGNNPWYQGFDSNRNALSGLFLGGVGAQDPRAAIRGAAQGFQGGAQADTGYAVQKQAEQERQRQLAQASAEKSKTLEWLRTNAPNYYSAAAAGVMSPADAYKQYLAEQRGGGGAEDPSSIREWNAYAAMTPEQQQQYLMMKRANPYRDTGAAFVLPDPINPGQTLGDPIVKQGAPGKNFDVTLNPNGTRAATPVAGTPEARDTAAANAQLQTTISKTEQTLQSIDNLANDEAGLNETFGNVGNFSINGQGLPQQWVPGAMPGTAKANFKTQWDQLNGQLFMEAYETLKGGGQITEVEGEKATNAMARLSTAQSKEAFIQGLNDLKEVIQVGLARAKAQAGGAALAPQEYTYDPATGMIQ